MVRAWHGPGMGMAWQRVNQTRLHCVNQMGKTHSKLLAARHGRGTAWTRYAMCESAFTGLQIVMTKIQTEVLCWCIGWRYRLLRILRIMIRAGNYNTRRMPHPGTMLPTRTPMWTDIKVKLGLSARTRKSCQFRTVSMGSIRDFQTSDINVRTAPCMY
jgi:hypothetical protein